MKKLVIVESPTKAKTLSRYLGSDYTIKFSMGHIMDLPKSTLGVDVEDKFKPELEVVMDKKPIIADLKDAAKSSSEIILATDPDREGEAIAANLEEILRSEAKAKNIEFSRIVFHEITKSAILEAIDSPRKIDHNLVNAQTARRVLDRLVGYKISPVLWKKVRRGLSAGRVQSVALRLIVEREKEIEKFSKENYFSIHAHLIKKDLKTPTEFELIAINDNKIEIQIRHELYDGEYNISKTNIDKAENADKILDDLKKSKYNVDQVDQKQVKRSPFPPYTTSTLQQDSSRRFGYPGRRTMSLAQKLYEEGFITYHRTDSVTISKQAVASIRKHIEEKFDKSYLAPFVREFKTKQKAAQEAHEGIRPTHIERSEDEVKDKLGADCAKLYDLIYRRAVGSQMADALIDSTSVKVKAVGNDTYILKANGSVLVFEGFLKLNPMALNDNKLPEFTNGEDLTLNKAEKIEHETAPPPRYNDASLIGRLEDKAIGRPSTYASIISVLIDRAYVERLDKRFSPTPVGVAVNDFLVKNFSTIDDIPFTAKMENDLDLVAEGNRDWHEMLEEFYAPFEKTLKTVEKADRIKIEAEKTDEKCPDCGNPLVIRTGRFGKFFSCSTFPDCKFTKPFVEKTMLTCPRDNGEIIIKKTRTGRKFYGCSNYPKCDYAAWKLEDVKKGIDNPKEKKTVKKSTKKKS